MQLQDHVLRIAEAIDAIDPEDRRAVLELAILAAFRWEDSLEGPEFWNGVYEALQDMGGE